MAVLSSRCLALFLLCIVLIQAAVYKAPTTPDQYVTSNKTIYYGNFELPVPPGQNHALYTLTSFTLDNYTTVYIYGEDRVNGKQPCQEKTPATKDVVKILNFLSKASSEDPETLSPSSTQATCIHVENSQKPNNWGELKYVGVGDTEITINAPINQTINVKLQKSTQCKSIRKSEASAFVTVNNYDVRGSSPRDRVLIYEKLGRYDCSRRRRCVWKLTGKLRTYVILNAKGYDANTSIPFTVVETSSVCVEFLAYDRPTLVGDAEVEIFETPLCGRGTKINLNAYHRRNVISSFRWPADPQTEQNFRIGDCYLNVTAEKGQRVQLDVEQFDSDCTKSFIRLDGVSGGMTGTELLCGTDGEQKGRSFISSSHNMSVTVINQFGRSYARMLFALKVLGCKAPGIREPRIGLNEKDEYPFGYKLRVGCLAGYVFPNGAAEWIMECFENNTWTGRGNIPRCEYDNVCNRTYTSPSGVIQSPGYPVQTYPRGLYCKWWIKAERGQHIRITILDMESDCANDYLLLESSGRVSPLPTDTPNTTQAVFKNALLCGNGSKGRVLEMISSEVKVDVTFQTNIYESLRGFSFKFEAIGCAEAKIRKTPNSLLVNTTDYYPFGYKLKVTCSDGFLFPSREPFITLTCGPTGKWQGTIPFCVAFS